MRHVALIAAAALAVLPASAFAQEPSPTGALTVTVREVAGSVQYRPDGNAGWRDATAGLELAEGSHLSTGLASKAGLAFADNSVVVIGSLTEVVIDKFLKDAEAVRTRLSMKSGSLRAKVRHDPVRSDFRVTTPNMTVSIKGTIIEEITTTPDMGDYVALGTEGLVLVESEAGERYVDAKTATTSELIRLVEQAKLVRTFKFAPLLGLTDAESGAAFDRPDQLDVSPAEVNNATFSPVGDHVQSQESGNSGHTIHQ